MLYAVAYDGYDNYINSIEGDWVTGGNLDEHLKNSSNFLEFKPIKAETSGTINFKYNEKTASTGIISVSHGALDHFEIKMSNPQIVGEILSNENTITALDKNNNLVIDFNAFNDNVVITSSSLDAKIIGLGSGNNNILNQASDFINGIANLSSLGMIYAGSSGEIIFEVKSSGDKLSKSKNIVYGWKIRSL